MKDPIFKISKGKNNRRKVGNYFRHFCMQVLLGDFEIWVNIMSQLIICTIGPNADGFHASCLRNIFKIEYGRRKVPEYETYIFRDNYSKVTDLKGLRQFRNVGNVYTLASLQHFTKFNLYLSSKLSWILIWPNNFRQFTERLFITCTVQKAIASSVKSTKRSS